MRRPLYVIFTTCMFNNVHDIYLAAVSVVHNVEDEWLQMDKLMYKHKLLGWKRCYTMGSVISVEVVWLSGGLLSPLLLWWMSSPPSWPMTSDAFSFLSSDFSLLSSWVKSWVSLWPVLLTRFITVCERDSVYMVCVQSYKPWGTWDTRGIGGKVSILYSSVLSLCMIVVVSRSSEGLSW